MLLFKSRKKIPKCKLQELTKAEIHEFYYGKLVVGIDEANPPVLAQPFDKKYELSENQLVVDFDRNIGSGQFGLVFHGTVCLGQKEDIGNAPIPVAIKTVKPNVDALHFKALLLELKMLTYVGKHENIASLIGAQTSQITSRTIFIATEFCAKGDLLQNLKNSRYTFTNVFPRRDNVRTWDQLYKSQVIAPTSEAATSNNNELKSGWISTLSLLQWACQISNGMIYLSGKKVIHGDLAARNILLTADNVAKISDFGLSCHLLNGNNHVKTATTPLPWRWMAIESLKNNTFSTQSDVWSFGIILWEIFTLGETPYSHSHWDQEFVEQLSQGKLQLHFPQFADDDIYDLMVECWRKQPMNRISFQFLSTRLNQILGTLSESQKTKECD